MEKLAVVLLVKNYNEQTAIVNALLSEWKENVAIIEAVTTLKITSFVEELGEANTKLNATKRDRNKEYAAKNPETFKDVRKATIPIFYELRNLIEAQYTIAPSIALETLIKQLSSLVTYYKTNTKVKKVKRKKE